MPAEIRSISSPFAKYGNATPPRRRSEDVLTAEEMKPALRWAMCAYGALILVAGFTAGFTMAAAVLR